MTTTIEEEVLITLAIFIGFLGACGLIAGYQARRVIGRQIRMFRREPNPLERDITSDTPPEKHAEQVEAKLEEYRQKKKIREKDHLSQRLFPMIKIAKQDNSMLRLPSLDDLHELSLEHEFGRISVNLLNTIQSTVLILGICGTLLGVEIGIGSGEFDPHELKSALLPGMVAVICTVLLTISKGAYSRTLDAYMSILDRYTIDTLVPCMQPGDTYDEKMEEMAQPIENLREGIDLLDTASQRLKHSVKQMDRYSRTLIGTDNNLHALLGALRGTVTAIESNVTSTCKQRQDAQKLCVKLKTIHEGLVLCEIRLRGLRDGFIHKMWETCKKLNKRLNSIQKTEEAIYSNSAIMEEYLIKAPKLDDTIKQIRLTQENILSMAAKESTLRQEIQRLQTNWEKLSEQAKSSDDILRQLKDNAASSQERLKQAKDYTEEYKQLRDSSIPFFIEKICAVAEKFGENTGTAKNYNQRLVKRFSEYQTQRVFLTTAEIILFFAFIALLINRCSSL